jgi:DeoR/GlpR family transcriptional regulator of sugar metabolism
MLTAEREQKIIQLLRSSRVLSVSDLSLELGVSEATIRRDLQSMDERKLLQRVRGGATLHSLTQAEPIFSDKEGAHSEAKQRIARAALALVEDHDVIYLDGGSTLLCLAQLLEARRDLTIVTNSMMAAASLMNTSHRLIIVGGEFRAISRTLVGPLTAPVIQSLNISKAFMGTIGFSLGDGMTTTDPSEAFTKEQILRRANQVILLADSSKFGVPSFARSGKLEDVNILVTESISAQFRHDLEVSGVRVRVAQKND